MATPKLSVCISVHNTANLLPRCLDSVMAQSLDSFETILVNNGSTDESADIMRRYISENPQRRITLIEQNDRGLAQGRQSGVNNAAGEYITFLDADDYVTSDAYEKMYAAAKAHDADVVECATEREGRLLHSPFDGECSPHELLKLYFAGKSVPSMLWQRIYKRSLFNENTFPKTYVNNEDNYVFPCILDEAANYFCINERLHFYTTDNETAVMVQMKKKTMDKKRVWENRKRYIESVDFIRERIGDERLKTEYDGTFDTLACAACLSFCLTRIDDISMRQKFDYVYRVLKMDKRAFNDFYIAAKKNAIAANKFIAVMGFENGVRVYNIVRKIFGK